MIFFCHVYTICAQNMAALSGAIIWVYHDGMLCPVSCVYLYFAMFSTCLRYFVGLVAWWGLLTAGFGNVAPSKFGNDIRGSSVCLSHSVPLRGGNRLPLELSGYTIVDILPLY